MALHTFAYYMKKGTTAEEEITVVKDDVLTRTTDTRFLVPAGLHTLYWGFAVGNYLGEARLFSPSLETKKYKARIIPRVVDSDLLPLTGNYLYLPKPALKFADMEEISFFASVTDVTAARNVLGVFSLGFDTLPAAPAGEPILVRCVGTTTLTPYQWTSVKITPEVQLEAGTYSVVGMIAYSANALAARLIIPGQVWRPGVPALSGASEYAAMKHVNELFAGLPQFEFGKFSHIALPEVQFLSAAADTSEVVYLKLIKAA